MKLAKKRAWKWKFSLLLLTSILFSQNSFSQDLTIFDSRKPVALSDDEQTHRDFYINGGVEHGVKKGMILTVKRRLTLYDTYKANFPKELMVDVARVKIIFTQKGLSVARIYGDFKRDLRTTLENDFIMVGDKIDMSSALMESQLKKKSAKKEGPKTKKAPEKKVASSSIDFASQAINAKDTAQKSPVPMQSLQ